jgi:GGDEF domain-containing protein
MSSRENALTHEEFLMLLNFSTRLLALDLNQEAICERALEALSDFSGCSMAGLMTLAPEAGMLTVRGVFSEVGTASRRSIAYRDTPLESVILEKQYGIFPASTEGLPIPPRGRCWNPLCIPMAASETTVTGVVTLEWPAGDPPGIGDIQTLIILTTAVAISLENASLFHLATRDGLTGLYVRTVFDIRLKEELARLDRYGGRFAVLIMDVDYFKEVNDRLGHRRGDEVLRELAGTVCRGVRSGVDIVCRYGGDEFIVLMTAADLQEASRIAERSEPVRGTGSAPGGGCRSPHDEHGAGVRRGGIGHYGGRGGRKGRPDALPGQIRRSEPNLLLVLRVPTSAIEPPERAFRFAEGDRPKFSLSGIQHLLHDRGNLAAVPRRSYWRALIPCPEEFWSPE